MHQLSNTNGEISARPSVLANLLGRTTKWWNAKIPELRKNKIVWRSKTPKGVWVDRAMLAEVKNWLDHSQLHIEISYYGGNVRSERFWLWGLTEGKDYIAQQISNGKEPIAKIMRGGELLATYDHKGGEWIGLGAEVTTKGEVL